VENFRGLYRDKLENDKSKMPEELVTAMVEVATRAYEQGLREGKTLGFADATTKKSECVEANGG
jgi:hypothetical protein